MRLATTFAALLLSSASTVFAQTAEDVKSDILSALATPLPITVIGPIITQDVTVTPSGDGFDAVLEQPMLMGIVPLGRLSFKLTPQGPKTYRVTDFKLPPTIDVFNSVSVAIGGTTFDGVWSAETRSYQTLGFQLNNLKVNPKGADSSKVEIGSVSLDVAKEGEAGAAESKFSLRASDIASQGFPPYNVGVKSLVAELTANGEKPVDLYSVISRFVVLSAMQGDGNAALQFAESLRAQSYDSVSLTVSAKGIAATGAELGSNLAFLVGEAGAVAGLTGVTPDEWGSVTVAIDGKGIRDNGILGNADIVADSGAFTIVGARIPIGATLAAIGKLQAISNGSPQELRVADVLDGLFNMGGLKVTSGASGISYLPASKDEPVVKVKSFSFGTGTEGFRDNKGRLFLETAVDDVSLDIKSFATPLEEKIYRLFNPKSIRYDLSVSDLNEQLLRKLMAEIVIRSEDDYAALAVPAITYAMALKPMIETRDMRYQSAEFEFGSSGALRFYPAWVLGALPYEGEQKLSLKGIDKIAALVSEVKSAPDGAAGDPGGRAALAMLESSISTFRALATEESGQLNWTIKYPKAGEGLFLINGTELRFPDLSASLVPLMTLGASGSLLGATDSYVPPPADTPPQTTEPALPAPEVQQ